MQTGGVIKAFSGPSGYVLSLSISVDCATIASGPYNTTIKLWDIQTGECHYTIKQQKEVYYIRLFPTNPQHLIFVSGNKVGQWNTIDHQINYICNGSHVAISSDGTQFVLCDGATVVIQNSNSGATMANFHVASDYSTYCCFSPNGGLIAVAAGNIVYVWDITSLDPHVVKTFTRHTEEITSLAFSSPSSLISSSRDSSVKFWQIDASPIDLVVIVMTFWYVFRNGLNFFELFSLFSFGIDHDPPCSLCSHDLCFTIHMITWPREVIIVL